MQNQDGDNIWDELNTSSGKDPNTDKKIIISFVVIALILVAITSVVAGTIGYYMAAERKSIVYKNPVINITPGEDNVVGVDDVVDVVRDSVVEITAYGSDMQSGTTSVSRGSGVVYTNDGYIITNAHVVENSSSPANIKVKLTEGSEYTATLCSTDKMTDIAIVKIDTDKELTQACIGDSSKIKQGEKVIAIGNPLGSLGGSVTDGIISALDRDIIIDDIPMRLLQTNAEINPGNSGGGLFNMNGELIGIVNAKASDEEIEGIGFAIPINSATEIADELILNGKVTGRTDDGISVVGITTISEAWMYMKNYGIEINEAGVYVISVDSRMKNTFKTGDKIVAIDGNLISSVADYNIARAQYKVGDNVEYTIKRGNTVSNVNVTLVEK